MAGVVPVFILNSQLPAFDLKPFTTAEICGAAEQTCGFETIVGAQRIGGLWRIYPQNAEARNKMLIQGFVLRGVRVEVKDKNPFVVFTEKGEEREIPATKLIINNIPLSFSDEELLKAVKKMGVNVRSKLIAERDRDKDGKLTRWKTGRRFIYIAIPKVPLPGTLDIGPFKATLYHREQKEARKQSETECRKCFQKGHTAASCTNAVKCRQCLQEGHVAGDVLCQLTPVTTERASDGGKISDHEQPPPTDNGGTEQSAPKSPRGTRGRTTTRQQTNITKSNQTKLNFHRGSDRSASVKRPRSKDSTSPQQHDKQPRQSDERPTVGHSEMTVEGMHEKTHVEETPDT